MELTPSNDSHALETLMEQHRSELTSHCYRMLGSLFEAEDAVQETLLRAWRSYGSFEGRAAVKSWLYRIATNVCYDLLERRNRRESPIDIARTEPFDDGADRPMGVHVQGNVWHLQAVPATDPAAAAELQESVRMAFVAALQHLPARQRAVLILREVLGWKAAEVAELLHTSTQSVNSLLQRARHSLRHEDLTFGSQGAPIDATQAEMLARYVEAFENYDMDLLIDAVVGGSTERQLEVVS